MRALLVPLVGLAAGFVLAVSPAWAHHRQTPPISLFTPTGDNVAPRTSGLALDFALAVSNGSSHVTTVLHDTNPLVPFDPIPVGGPGDDANPAISRDRKVIVWDSTVVGLPGRQIYMKTSNGGAAAPITSDPAGACVNPAIDGRGRTVTFECTYDLAATGSAAVRRIIRWDRGVPSQVSTGHGSSHNPTTVRNGSIITYDSTDDPIDGHDTGVPQIWIANSTFGTNGPITAGLGASRRPSTTDKGRLFAFDSQADLAGDGHDTGVPQIYVFDPRTVTYGKLTDEPNGCTGATVLKAGAEYFVGFVCDHEARLYEVRADRHTRYPLNVGSANGMTLTYSRHFALISTTADLLNPGSTTPGHLVYLWNLFKVPGEPLPVNPVWFPFRGIKGF